MLKCTYFTHKHVLFNLMLFQTRGSVVLFSGTQLCSLDWGLHISGRFISISWLARDGKLADLAHSLAKKM